MFLHVDEYFYFYTRPFYPVSHPRNELQNMQVVSLMHLSMLSPRVGESDPGDFDIFIEVRVKFPTPGHLVNVKFPHPSGKFFCKRHARATFPENGICRADFWQPEIHHTNLYLPFVRSCRKDGGKTPKQCEKAVEILCMATRFQVLSAFQDGGHVKFPTQGQYSSVKIPSQGKAV